MKTLLVNLFGGPGAGKSTAATGVFYRLKVAGINAEYVSEIAKDFVWEQRQQTLKYQPYIFGKQLRNLERLDGQVDVIITDSPILLSSYYTKKYRDHAYDPSFYVFAAAQFKRMGGLNFFIDRAAPYQAVGRNQNETQSDEVALELRAMLDDLEIAYTRVNGDEQAVDTIVNAILLKAV